MQKSVHLTECSLAHLLPLHITTDNTGPSAALGTDLTGKKGKKQQTHIQKRWDREPEAAQTLHIHFVQLIKEGGFKLSKEADLVNLGRNSL